MKAAVVGIVAGLAAIPAVSWAQGSGGMTMEPAKAVLGAAGKSANEGAGMSMGAEWLLIAGFLVLLMQLGFAMVETGLTRAKNAAHSFAMNLMIVPLGCLAFFVYGFALGWGNWAGAAHGAGGPVGAGLAALNAGWAVNGWTLLGMKGFFLRECTDPAVLALVFFTMAVMNVAAAIPTGAMCERWRWGNFCLYGLFAALPFGIMACWTWGGGWLAQLGTKAHLGHGYVDFAGSGVVHLLGGMIGLIGAMVMGPRIGKFINGRPVAIPGHNLPLVMGGTIVLTVGWFGLDAGWALSGTDVRISTIAVNTLMAAAAAAISSMLIMQFKFGKPDPSIMCNGMLAGLVAITAPCAFVSPQGAVIIGAIAGVLVVYSIFFWDNMGVDDPVGAVSIHGVNGLFGVLCVGLFATGEYGGGWNGVSAEGAANQVVGILPIGSTAAGVAWFSPAGWGQMGAQCIGGVTCIVVAGILALAWFKLSNLVVPMRSSRETEIQGCDIPEMGALAYPDFELKTVQSVSDVAPMARV